jgi:hypothetical protein
MPVSILLSKDDGLMVRLQSVHSCALWMFLRQIHQHLSDKDFILTSQSKLPQDDLK